MNYRKCLSLRTVVGSGAGTLQHRRMPWHRRAWRAAIYLALCACVLMTGCRLVVDPDEYAPGNSNVDGDGDGGPQNGPDSSPNTPPAPCDAWSLLYFDNFCDYANVPELPAWRLPAGEYTLDTGLGTLVGPEPGLSIPGSTFLDSQTESVARARQAAQMHLRRVPAAGHN